MRVTMLLADYAAVQEGKLTIVGGGWSVIGPQPSPFGIALLVQVPWDRTNEQHTLRLALFDADGAAVTLPGQDGSEQEVVVFDDLGFEIGRPPGVKPGTPIDFPLAVNVAPLPHEPGSRYEWRLTLDGEERDDWRLAFSTRAN